MSRRPIGPDGLPEKLGANIKAARLSLGLTQGELTGEDLTRNMLSRIENGAALPSLPTLCTIAEKLGMPPSALLGDLGGYFAERITHELRRLLAKNRYSDVIDRWNSHISKYPDAEPDDELREILITAMTEHSIELFRVGKLTAAIDLLNRVDHMPDPKGFDVSNARTKALTCRMLINGTTGQKCPAEKLERLSDMVFTDNGRAIYVIAREMLSDSVGKAYSEPDEHAAEYRLALTPLLERLPHGLIRDHIEAKLLMTEAEYLNAKALMIPLIREALPPSVLYDLYSDLEHCCKCCGDFENAYKYSNEKVGILQRLK